MYEGMRTLSPTHAHTHVHMSVCVCHYAKLLLSVRACVRRHAYTLTLHANIFGAAAVVWLSPAAQAVGLQSSPARSLKHSLLAPAGRTRLSVEGTAGL
jgi:hypothetical protein